MAGKKELNSLSTEELRERAEKLTQQRAELRDEAREVGDVLRERERDEAADSILEGLSQEEIDRLAERAQVVTPRAIEPSAKVGAPGKK